MKVTAVKRTALLRMVVVLISSDTAEQTVQGKNQDHKTFEAEKKTLPIPAVY